MTDFRTIVFAEPYCFETDGVRKGPTFEADQPYIMRKDRADRMIGRGVAKDYEGRAKPIHEADILPASYIDYDPAVPKTRRGKKKLDVEERPLADLAASDETGSSGETADESKDAEDGAGIITEADGAAESHQAGSD